MTPIQIQKLKESRLQEAAMILGSDPSRYGKFDQVTCAGFLALARAGQLVWNEWIKSPITQTPDFRGTDFREDPIDFSGFEFPTINNGNEAKCVNFSGSSFDRNTTFDNAKFGDRADFTNTIFSEAHFENATFGGKADFKNATFSEDADFWRAEFGFSPDFSNCDFKKNATFISASFDDKAMLNDCEFRSTAHFNASDSKNASDSQKSLKSISFSGRIDFS
jgi:uncharacterized protein YjbI with pentapeptide repeats